MGQRVAVEYQCDRCSTTWYEDFDVEAQKPKRVPASLDISLSRSGETPRTVSFAILCASCDKTCTNYIDNITKDLKRKSGAKKKSGEGRDAEAPPPKPSREPPRKPSVSAASERTLSTSGDDRST